MRHAILICLAITGCNKPRFNYEPRPVKAPAPPSSCYESQRLELATGHFSWSQMTDSGTSVTPGAGGSWTMSYHGPARYEGVSGRGLVAHAGGRRLDAVAALQRIGDRSLLEEHEIRLELTAGPGGRYQFYRKGSLGLIATGTPITLVGLGMLLVMDDPKPGGYTAIGGLTMLAVGMGLHIGTLLSGKDYARHKRDQKILVNREVARRAAAAAYAHNQRLAESCNAAPDLPMTKRARTLLEKP